MPEDDLTKFIEEIVGPGCVVRSEGPSHYAIFHPEDLEEGPSIAKVDGVDIHLTNLYVAESIGKVTTIDFSGDKIKLRIANQNVVHVLNMKDPDTDIVSYIRKALKVD